MIEEKGQGFKQTPTTTAGASTNGQPKLPPPPPPPPGEPPKKEEPAKTNNGIKLPAIFYEDFDSPKMQRKWNNPNEDITDYFNYGMNEESWKIYANKVRDLADAADKDKI